MYNLIDSNLIKGVDIAISVFEERCKTQPLEIAVDGLYAVIKNITRNISIQTAGKYGVVSKENKLAQQQLNDLIAKMTNAIDQKQMHTEEYQILHK